MPKIVDHQQRRQEIAAAVHRILLREGLEGATVRAVVTESGMSSGAIRHYFPNHQELLRFAASQIEERASARAVAAYAAPGRGSRARVLDVLEQFLPLDPEREMELAVSTALARMGSELPQIQAYWEGIRRACRGSVVVLAGTDGEVNIERPLRPARWERLAERLHLILDGLSAQTLFYSGRTDPTAIRASLARAVDDLRAELA